MTKIAPIVLPGPIEPGLYRTPKLLFIRVPKDGKNMNVNLYKVYEPSDLIQVPQGSVILVLRSFEDNRPGERADFCITQILWNELVGWCNTAKNDYEYKL